MLFSDSIGQQKNRICKFSLLTGESSEVQGDEFSHPETNPPPHHPLRPGCCAGDGPAAAYKSSITFPDEMLTFIKSYPLMDEAVPSVNDRPCFSLTGSRYASPTPPPPQCRYASMDLTVPPPPMEEMVWGLVQMLRFCRSRLAELICLSTCVRETESARLDDEEVDGKRSAVLV